MPIAFDEAMVCSSKFSPGQIFATEEVLMEIPRDELLRAVDRHIYGDWGDVNIETRERNERALDAGGELISQYRSSNSRLFAIRTEPDHSSTRIYMIDAE